ncbi:MAG: hypothetical protein NTZ23_08525 [Cyanobium sp. LacPavin_0920_WC12_MAG_63_22]|nr:hypothetical protein [Cyanobium sp. LacPavin_0920_WC12_MAG_63_22]
MPTTRPGRRGLRKRSAEEPQGDGVLWPLLREQQLLRAHIPEADQQAAEARAQLLVSQGYGALQGWLEALEAHPGERPAVAPVRELGVRQSPATLADLFDAA